MRKRNIFGISLLLISLFIISGNIITPISIAQFAPEQLQMMSSSPMLISINTQTEWDINESTFVYIGVIDSSLGEIILNPELTVTFADINGEPLRILQTVNLTNNNGLFTAKFEPLNAEGSYVITVVAYHNGRSATESKVINRGQWKDSTTKADLEFIQLYSQVTSINQSSQQFKSSSLKTVKIIDAYKKSLELYSFVRPVVDSLKDQHYHIFYINISNIEKSLNDTMINTYHEQIKETINNLTYYGLTYDETIINTTSELEQILGNNLSMFSVNESSNNSIIFNMHGDIFPVNSSYDNETLLERYFLQVLTGTMALKWKWGFIGEPLMKIGFDNGTTIFFNDTNMSNGFSGWEWIANNTEIDLNSFENSIQPIEFQLLEIGEKISSTIVNYTFPDNLNLSDFKYLPTDVITLRQITPIYIDPALRIPLGIFQNTFFTMAFSTINGSNDGYFISSLIIGIIINLLDSLITKAKETYSSINVDISSYYPSEAEEIYQFVNAFDELKTNKNYTGIYHVLNQTSYFTADKLVPIYNLTLQEIEQDLSLINDTSINVSSLYEGLKLLGTPYCFMTILAGVMIGGTIAVGVGAGLIIAGNFPPLAFLKGVGIAVIIGGLLAVAIALATAFWSAGDYVKGIFNTWAGIIQSTATEVISKIHGMVTQVQGIIGDAFEKGYEAVEMTLYNIADKADDAFVRLQEVWGDLSDKGITTVGQLHNNIMTSLSNIGSKVNQTLQKFSTTVNAITSDVNLVLTNLLPKIMGQISTIQHKTNEMAEMMSNYLKIGLSEVQTELNIMADEMGNLRNDFNNLLTYILGTITVAPQRVGQVFDITRNWWVDTTNQLGSKINAVFLNVKDEADFFFRTISVLPYTINTYTSTRSRSSGALGILDYVFGIFGKKDDLFYNTDEVITPVQDGIMADTGLRLTLTPTMIKKGEDMRIFVKLNESEYDPSSIDVQISSPNNNFLIIPSNESSGLYRVPLAGLDVGEYIVTINIDNSSASTKITIMVYQPEEVISPWVILGIVLGILFGVIGAIYLIRYIRNRRKKQNKEKIVETKW